MSYAVFGKTYKEPEDFVPAIPERARRLRPGEVLRIRRTDRGLQETIERRGASSAPPAPAASRGPKTLPPRPASLAAPAAAGGGFRYVWVREADVPYRTRQAAHAALLVARDRLLGGRMPQLRWFRPALEREEAGFTEAGDTLGTANYITWTIGLRSDMDPRTTRESLWHECGHLANLSEAECERLAWDLVMGGAVVLARIVDLALRRARRELEQRRRTAVRLLGFDPADDDDGEGAASTPAEPPATGGVVIRLEHPAGGGRRETRG